MAERWTNAARAEMADYLREELTAAGIIPATARVYIEEGSRTYGRCWRVAVIPEGSSAHHQIPGIGDLYGVTGAECRAKCYAVAAALVAARRVREGDEYMLRVHNQLAEAQA